MILRAAATAVLAVSLMTAGGTFHGAARSDGLRAAAPAGVMLAAGAVGPRSSVPWRLVGPGWVLGQYSASTLSTKRPTTLYLVDPRGGRYTLYTWPASKLTPSLGAWSGDKARALLFYPSLRMSQIVLATGHVENIPFPSSRGPIGYTMPDGLNLLAVDIPNSGTDRVLRYNLAGQLQKVLVSGHDIFSAVDNPDGVTLAVTGDRGLELVSNLGGVIRKLPVSGSSAGICVPVRWWSSGTILANCPSGLSQRRLWLVPASGAAPTALTPPRGNHGIDLGDQAAWRLRSGLYLQAAGACGTIFIARQASNGSVTQINVPGTLNADNYVLAADGARLLVHARTYALHAPCGPAQSLLWFNPATRAEQWLFRTPAGAEGVLAAFAYRRPNG